MRAPPEMSKKLHLQLVSLVSALLVASASYADFKDAYKDGVRAAGDQNWALVETKMREALSDEPTPQAKVRLYGMRFEPYLPHHYLALAASAKNNCAAALAALNNSAHQSALSGARDATPLVTVEQQIKRRCQSAAPSIAQPNVTSAPITPASSTAPAATTPIATTPIATTPIATTPVATTPIAAPVVKPPATVQTPATRPSTTPTPTVAVAPTLANADIASVRSAVQALKRELSAARSTYAKPELAVAASAKSAELNALEQEATRLTQDLERAIANVDTALLSRTGTAASAASTRATTLKLAANAALAAAAPLARQAAPPALAQIAKSFFGGDFKTAAQANVESLQGKALAHALLVRAAARYSMYVAQGESKAEQLNAVKVDLTRAKSVDATVRPSAKYFSPRLIQLY